MEAKSGWPEKPELGSIDLVDILLLPLGRNGTIDLQEGREVIQNLSQYPNIYFKRMQIVHEGLPCVSLQICLHNAGNEARESLRERARGVSEYIESMIGEPWYTAGHDSRSMDRKYDRFVNGYIHTGTVYRGFGDLISPRKQELVAIH